MLAFAMNPKCQHCYNAVVIDLAVLNAVSLRGVVLGVMDSG